MKISIIAYGTRGDLQPVLALGKALKAQGHAVRMAAGANFKSWIERHGLEAAASGLDMQELMMSEGGKEWVQQGSNPLKQARLMKLLFRQYGFAMMQDAWKACRDADFVISSFTSDVYAASIAEKLNARHISTPLQPTLLATRSGVVTPQAPQPNRISVLNYLFGKLFIEPFRWKLMGAVSNRFRREVLGLPLQTRRENTAALRRMLILQGYSAHVAPHPDDWPANIHTTGYWFLDEGLDWRPPQSLLEFLNSGEPPVYVGFGSMTGQNPEALTDLTVEGLAKSGQRAILQTGWAGIGNKQMRKNIFVLNEAPHHWLFPRMSIIVHHGGAGTTAESLRAGKPAIIVPHMADQPFWGARVAALGAGPQPIPRNKLTSENLAAAIKQAKDDPAMQERAAALAARIRSEDGLKAAVALILKYA